MKKNYDVYVFCNECGDMHRMAMGVAIEDGPAEKQSIGYTYGERELPPVLAGLFNNPFKCPETGKSFIQDDRDQVFLVPVFFV